MTVQELKAELERLIKAGKGNATVHDDNGAEFQGVAATEEDEYDNTVVIYRSTGKS